MKLMKPFKLLIVLAIGFTIFSNTSFNTIDASDKEIEEEYTLFEEEVTLNGKMTKIQVGFAEVTFKNRFLPEEAYPITFDIKLYAENGDIYIEFDPDYDDFVKEVVIRITAYEGYIYDQGTGEFIYIEVPKAKFEVSHFSRWRWMR